MVEELNHLLTQAATMDARSRSEQLDAEILDGVSELIGRILALGEGVARRLSVPGIFIKALHTLECPMAMKDIGKRLHCDPSFVTMVADMLEKRGLARREAHPGDRRVKNLILTGDGLALRHRIESELAARMPWSRVLSQDERELLLVLIRKMLVAEDLPAAPETDSPVPDPAAGPLPPPDRGEVTGTLSSTPAAAS
jgi:DNA-binding MarR family transcriptional regulator